MRLIDADNLKARIMEDVPGFLDGGSSITKAFILAMLGTRNATPTIDAVPVVRCEECKWNRSTEHNPICEKYYGAGSVGWFCADGEKKDDDTHSSDNDCNAFDGN